MKEKRTFREMLRDAGKGFLLTLASMAVVAAFIMICYYLPFKVIWKDVVCKDALTSIIFSSFFVMLFVAGGLYTVGESFDSKGALIALIVIAILFGFLPNIIMAPNYIHSPFGLGPVFMFTMLFFPAAMFLVFYIIYGMGIEKYWISMVAPIALVIVSLGLMALLCLISSLVAFLVALAMYPATVVAVLILKKINGSILYGENY